VASGYGWTNLVFDGTTRVEMDRRAVVGTIERRLGSRWTLQLGAGGILWGSLVTGDKRYTFGPGWSVSMSTSYRLRDGRDGGLFVLLGGSISAAGATTKEERRAGGAPAVPYYAGDIRFSAVAGKTFFNALSPYVVGRVFGGPIFWAIDGKDRTGTDLYHYQIGLGLSASVPQGLDVFAEIIGAGEKAVTVGAGYSF